ncbi:MAG: hypothetical protein QM784_18950 [Polyangiaceae bacterium]
MRIARLITCLSVVSAASLLFAASCSSDEEKTLGAGGRGGDGGLAGEENRGGDSSAGGSINAGGTTGIATMGSGGATTGGSSATPTTALNELISSVCAWEFKCCDAGEARYELGPTLRDAATCKEKFVYELRVGNSQKSPFPSSTVSSLLNTLGYVVDLNNVTEYPIGINECIKSWQARECNRPIPTKSTEHCAEAQILQKEACALTNLVKPKLEAGATCNLALAETATSNDVECVAGTTCVAAETDDNTASVPRCMTRGREGLLCTSDKDCDFEHYCNFTTGKCTVKAATGEACAYKDETAPSVSALRLPCKAGLFCNPLSKTCVAPCQTGSLCNDGAGSTGDDWACKSGESCLPTTIGTMQDRFKLCGAAQNTVTRCDSAEDCGTGYYCKTGACAAVGKVNNPCNGTAAECGSGLYCKDGVVPTCAPYVALGAACTPRSIGSTESRECNPTEATAGCVFQSSTLTSHVCAATLLSNGAECEGDWDCASRRCEATEASATHFQCTGGAVANAPCDNLTASGDALRCGEGLACIGGKCVTQANPGDSCATTEGTADSLLCKNGECNASTWHDASLVLCTDAPVPVRNGGTDATCDGR